MIEDEMNTSYSSKSGQWNKVIAFSAKDVATILNLPLSSVTRYMRKGKLKTLVCECHISTKGLLKPCKCYNKEIPAEILLRLPI